MPVECDGAWLTTRLNYVRPSNGIQTEVTAVKRLGHALAGKIQPLLVNMKHDNQAHQLISVAKQLRKPSDLTVRGQVDINSNLPRAEAEAAYQIRQQRRRAADRRAKHGHSDERTTSLN